MAKMSIGHWQSADALGQDRMSGYLD